MGYFDRRTNITTSKITKTAAITTTSQVILSNNSTRVGCLFWNPTANSVYLAYGPLCDGNTQTCIVAANSTWSMPDPIYCGAISCIRNAGSGSIFITELIA